MIRRYITILGLLIASILVSTQANATHIMGASITWDYAGKDSFEVKLKVYRDCTGVAIQNNPQLNVGCKSGSLGNADTTLLSYNGGKDVTPVCSSTTTQCPFQNPGASISYGIEEHVSTYLVDLSNAGSCCKVKFSYEGNNSRRSNSITTGLDGDPYYVESWINRCKDADDNSPEFRENPGTILCKGNFYVGDFGASDQDTTAAGLPKDSLGYELAKPLEGPNSPISYNPPYTFKAPFDFRGLAPTLPTPFGFHLDNETGVLRFTPTKKQTSVLKIRVNEYKKSSSGKAVKIGEVNRDVQVFVTNCPNNNNPSVKGMTCKIPIKSLSVCEGNLFLTEFCTNDKDPNDSVRLKFDRGNLPGSPSFTIKDPNAKYQKGQLKWIVPKGSARSFLYRFSVTAIDDNCAIPGRVTETYTIKVEPTPEKPSYSINPLGCGRYRITTTAPDKKTNVTVFIDGKQYSKDSFVHKLDQPNQAFPVSISAKGKRCQRTIRDTIRTDSILTVDLGKDTTVCKGSNLTVNANVRFDKGPVSYTWQDSVKNTKQRTFTNLQQDTTIWVKAVDDTCTTTAQLKIKVDTFGGQVNLIPDTAICTTGDTFIAKAPSQQASQYQWSNGGKADSTILTAPGTYSVKVTKASGCTGTDSFKVSNRLSPSPLPDSAFFCKGDSLSLTAQSGNSNATYNWSSGQSVKSITVNGSGTYSVQTSVDSNCKVTDTVNVQQVPKAKVSLRNDTAFCEPDSVQLSADTGFRSYKWSTGDTTRQIWVMKQGQYSVTVSNGVCSASDSVQIDVYNTPSINLQADTTICATDSIQLMPKSGYANYSWSTGDTSRTIWAGSQKQYTVTVTTAKGCTTTDTFGLTTVNDCVWPGDANNDGIANNQDILQIGVKYNVTGKTRSNQGTQWQAYKASDWTDTFSSGLNTKFADCDGDGTVQTSDTLAVSQNYNRTHNKRGLEGRRKDGEAPVSLVVQQESIEPGDQVKVDLRVGTKDNAVQTLYGIAANLTLNNKVLKPDQLKLEGGNIGNNDPNFISFSKLFNQGSRLEIAVTRTDQQEVDGQVVAATLILPLKENTGKDTLKVTLRGEYPVNAQGKPVPYDRGTTTVKQAIKETTGVANSSAPSQHVQVYPNPAADQLNIDVSQVNPSGARLINGQGQVVKRFDVSKGSNRLNIGTLPAGPYHLMMRTPEGPVQQTIVVQ